MTQSKPITAERLRELLSYDPETGIFRWRDPSRRKRGNPDGTAGCLYKGGWLRIQVDEGNYAAASLAWLYMTGEWPAQQVDHEDLNRSNNRWRNLRPATPSQNCANRGISSSNTSGAKGVSWEPRIKKWRALLQPRGQKKIHLGYFTSVEEAKAAYDKAALERYGDFFRSA